MTNESLAASLIVMCQNKTIRNFGDELGRIKSYSYFIQIWFFNRCVFLF